MTNDATPPEQYFDEVRHRAFAATQSLRMEAPNLSQQDTSNRLRIMLANVLPMQYGVATGTIISSSRKLQPVKIEGALIYDQTQNSPLLHAVGEDEQFPIETILAAVSRIKVLKPDSAQELKAAILPLRQMAQRGKFYQSHDIVTKPNGKTSIHLREWRSDTPPRTLVAAQSMGWTRADEAIKGLKAMLQRLEKCHLDGLLVLDRDWFFYQPDNKQRIEISTESGTINFVQKLISDLSGSDIGTVSLARYWSG